MNELTSSQVFVQLLGGVALVLSLLVFQVNRRSRMLKFHLCASLFYAMHFFLLGAYSGAAVNLVNMLRNYMFFKIDRKKHDWLTPAIFIVLFVTVGIITWQGWISLLPMISAISGTIAFWQDKPKYIRIFSLIVSPSWFAYAFLVGSYPMMISEMFMFSSDIIGLFRYNYPIKFEHRYFGLHHKKRLHP